MILSFRVRNFRSLHNDQVLSLIASPNLDGEQPAIKSFPNLKLQVLPSAAIYGANASGKTALTKALFFFSRAVRHSQNTWQPTGPIDFQPFALADPHESSEFELDFVLKEQRYNYGFSIDRMSVLREWLYVFPNTKKKLVFKRENKHSFTYGKSLTGQKKFTESIVRENSLFLSAAAQSGHDALTDIFTFISEWMFIEDKEAAKGVAAHMCADPTLGKMVQSLLRSADLGIVSLKFEKVKVEEDARRPSATHPKALPSTANKSNAIAHEDTVISMTHRGPKGKEFVIESDEESRGTIAYIGLLTPVVIALSAGGVLCVDEIDESLHPSLTREIIRLFRSDITNRHGAQLIFNTHDANLLDLDLLRRDQIWFTEKDNGGETHLYPLTDFKPRASENIERGYLQGRYGAVPFLGDFTRLLPEISKSHNEK
jgi:uncharacterized protein